MLSYKIILSSQLSFSLTDLLALAGDLHPLVLGVVLDPLHDSVGVSLSVVLEGFGCFVLAPEFESGEALDVHSGNLVFSRIDLHQEDVGVDGQSPCSLVVVGSQVLAVSAPGGVELNQDLLVRVNHNFFEILSDNNLDGFVIFLRDGGRFEEGVDLSVVDSLHEGGELIGGNGIGFVFELLNLFVEEQDLRGGLGVDAEVLRKSIEESVSVILGGDGEDEVGGGLIEGLEGFMCRRLCGLVSEEEEEGGFLLLEDLLNGGVIEGDNLCV